MGQLIYEVFFAKELTVFVYVFAMIFIIMLIRQTLALIFYIKLWVNSKSTTIHTSSKKSVTVLVTCSAEEPDVFAGAMKALRQQEGLEEIAILVMMDGFDEPSLKDIQCLKIAQAYADFVFLTNAHNKRVNLANLMALARQKEVLYEFVAPMDSDTICDHNQVLSNLLAAFDNPQVGGATTAQRCLRTETYSERIGDWLEHARLFSSMAAASLFGQVMCLPGRLYAIRSHLIEFRIAELPRERWWAWTLKKKFPFVQFLRVGCKAGDDRWITNVVLREGYETVLVPKAPVKTLVASSFSKMFRTWRRWGISSQGYTYRTLSWSWKKPFVLFQGISDIFITHASVFLIWRWFVSALIGERKMLFPLGTMIAISMVGMLMTFAIRQLPHLWARPRDVFLLPLFILIVNLGQHIRLLSHWYWVDIGAWGTRRGGDVIVTDFWVKEDEVPKNLLQNYS